MPGKKIRVSIVLEPLMIPPPLYSTLPSVLPEPTIPTTDAVLGSVKLRLLIVVEAILTDVESVLVTFTVSYVIPLALKSPVVTEELAAFRV
ncbi:hypothetical protein D3C72_1744930 [compost metagenome]